MSTESPGRNLVIVCKHGKRGGAATIIATLRPFNPRGTNALTDADRWTLAPIPRGSRRVQLGEPLPDGRRKLIFPSSSTVRVENLIDDRPYDRRKHGDDAEGDYVIEGRKRWHFRCTRCGYALTVRAENLDPVLWRIRHAGLDEVELHALGAKLS